MAMKELVPDSAATAQVAELPGVGRHRHAAITTLAVLAVIFFLD